MAVLEKRFTQSEPLTIEYSWFSTLDSLNSKTPVLTGVMMLYSTWRLYTKERIEFGAFKPVAGACLLDLPGQHALRGVSRGMEAESQDTKKTKNRLQYLRSIKAITQNDTPNDTSIYTWFWYTEPNFDTPFSTSNGPINSICWGLSHFVD